MYAHSIENCCGVCEIGEFYERGEPEKLTQKLKQTILQYIKDDWEWYEYEEDKKTAYRTTNFFIATTNVADQPHMVAPLEALGFRKRVFNSKHGGKVYFWSRRGLPKEIKKEWNAFVKQALKEEDY